MQKRCNSSANALELHLFYIKPAIYWNGHKEYYYSITTTLPPQVPQTHLTVPFRAVINPVLVTAYL